MTVQPVLIGEGWRDADHRTTFRAVNPATGEQLQDEYPVSSWADCEAALNAASAASDKLQHLPAQALARFLRRYAERIEQRRDDLVEAAHRETALPKSPRLADVELPRTTGQLRQAAAAAEDGSWSLPTIDTNAGIRSCHGPIGPVCVFGPNNFPFAFGSISGGDFAAAIAAGNPVIAKANSSHPRTTQIFAEEAWRAANESDLPPGTVQLIYRLDHADGERLVADQRVGATAYTGSRKAGLALKAAADRAGKPIYLELSSVNPVVMLPGALKERLEEIADEFTQSCLLGTGQFCTNPGLVFLIDGPSCEPFVQAVVSRFEAAPVGTLLSAGVRANLEHSLSILREAGAELLTHRADLPPAGFCHPNTLMRVIGRRFLADPDTFQTEAFGNASLVVVCRDVLELAEALRHIEGNLTGCFYSARDGQDDQAYDELAPILRRRVGRLLNDKMPTGVAVSPAMNHGGPYPATGHPGFTAVGIPASLRRFSMLQCYDQVRPDRLPWTLQDKNPNGTLWRWIDGRWSQGDVEPHELG